MDIEHGFSRRDLFVIFERRGQEPPSLRQLSYWASTGLIDATVTGGKAIYSFQAMLDVMVIMKLLDGGVSLQRIRKALDYLAVNCGWGSERPTLGSLDLLTDGQDIYIVTEINQVMSLLRSPGQHGWRAICLPTAEIVRSCTNVVMLQNWRGRLTATEQATYLAG